LCLIVIAFFEEPLRDGVTIGVDIANNSDSALFPNKAINFESIVGDSTLRDREKFGIFENKCTLTRHSILFCA